MEQELADARNSKDEATKLDDVLAALKPQGDDTKKPSDDGEVKLTAADIQKIVESKITDISNKSTQADNIKAVASKFKELYGEKASETLYGNANDLGLSKEDINSLIAKNPTAALRMLGVDTKTKPADNDTFTGNVNTDSFQHKE